MKPRGLGSFSHFLVHNIVFSAYSYFLSELPGTHLRLKEQCMSVFLVGYRNNQAQTYFDKISASVVTAATLGLPPALVLLICF